MCEEIVGVAIELIKTGKCLDRCHKDQIQKMLREDFHVERTSYMSKEEVVELAKSFLEPETLLIFKNRLTMFGLTKKEIRKLYECPLCRVDRIISNGLITPIAKYHGHYPYSIMFAYIYDISDVITAYQTVMIPGLWERAIEDDWSRFFDDDRFPFADDGLSSDTSDSYKSLFDDDVEFPFAENDRMKYLWEY